MTSEHKTQADAGSVNLADEEAAKQVVINSILGLWDVVNNLTRLRPSRRDRYRVTIFGSARATPGSPAYDETKRAAAALAAMGCDIITGGGPGLMQAANEGATATPGRAQSVGIRVDLPFEQNVNAFVSQAFEHRTFFTRLHQFVLMSDAFVVVHGGIGTMAPPLCGSSETATLAGWTFRGVKCDIFGRIAPAGSMGGNAPSIETWKVPAICHRIDAAFEVVIYAAPLSEDETCLP